MHLCAAGANAGGAGVLPEDPEGGGADLELWRGSSGQRRGRGGVQLRPSEVPRLGLLSRRRG